MSKQSLRVAIEKGKKLRKCESLKEAESYFLNFKETVLGQFDLVAGESPFFTADYKVESLKALEKWYFHLIESDEFEQLGMNRNDFETVLAMYFGEVVVRNNEDAKWEVEEYAFVPGRYTFGVCKGLVSMAFGNGFKDHYLRTPEQEKKLVVQKVQPYLQGLSCLYGLFEGSGSSLQTP
ncbi:hypothetical protein [Planococcus shenhongbingii]|uniref:Uncharacterized protein n=1 Tax=Planococcus shenhongbingii TaxID=3058398 RepID=A0ABT8NCF2_9BACL|nr:hypothetical protein [Planococcus sp. N017]MDN7245563.1 hypothetical protein [Planococcus sp. N017]